jgi:uncharacterized protein (DUF2147 family)
MKKFLCIIVFVLIALGTKAQSDPIGIWLTDQGESQIQIFKTANGKLAGKIVWMQKEKDKCDVENPDVKLRSRKIQGLELMKDFVYDKKENNWSQGTIYDPKSGKTYTAYFWFGKDANTLQLKGFVLGMRFLGRETTWKRESSIRL